MQSGWVGDKVSNIIPSDCVADIDIRLVPESIPERLIKTIRNYIEDQNYYIIDRDPTDEERLKHENIIKFESSVSYEAFRTPIQSEPGIWLNNSIIRAFGSEPIKIRTMGGSLPITPFINLLNVPSVIVPTVNNDNNQHSHNENLRLGNYSDGIKIIISILTEPF
jgi:acetylornithine deacetylase/succinyl-diaminopimelate desuccinylase-like protein